MSIHYELMGRLRLHDHPDAWRILAELEPLLVMPSAENALAMTPVEPDEFDVTIDFAEECSTQAVDAVEEKLRELTPLLKEPARLLSRCNEVALTLYLGTPQQRAQCKSEDAVSTIMEVIDDLLPMDRLRAATILIRGPTEQG